MARSYDVPGDECDAIVACTYRSFILTTARALDVYDGDLASISETPTWLYAATALVLFLIAVGVVALSAARLRPGPISVDSIQEVRGTETIDRADLQAIITDRLARIGIQSATTVPASNLVEQTPSKIAEIPNFLARAYSWLMARSTERAGYSLKATLRTSDRADGYGLTFVAASRANGRRLHAETMWARTPEEAARRVAFQIGAVVANIWPLPQTKRAPTWTPSLESLRYYESGSYYIDSGRFDESFLACQAGLEHDPGSLPLRYLLGTLHERFGHFKSAAETYAGAINVLFHKGTAFSRSDKPDMDNGSRGRARRPGRAPFRRVVSDEATQILWRYAVSLTFGHRWTGRWLDDLRRSDGEVRLAPLGYRKEVHGALSAEPAFSRLEEIEGQEMRGRHESAKRMRGFFHVRYEWLLRDTFPILDTGVFGEQRQSNMAGTSPPVGKGKSRTEVKPPRLDQECRRMFKSQPLKSSHGVAEIGQWLTWLFACAQEAANSDSISHERKKAWLTYLRGWQLAPAGHPAAQFHPPDEGLDKFSYDDLVTEENYDNAELIRGLAAIPSALTGDKPKLTRLVSNGSQRSYPKTDYHAWFSRQRVLMLAYRVAKDLLKNNSDLQQRVLEQGGAEMGDDKKDEIQRIGFMVVQLDLRFFFLCCAREEMRTLVSPWRFHRREVWSRPFLSPQLVRMGMRGVLYRREERLHEVLSELPEWSTKRKSWLLRRPNKRKSSQAAARRRLTGGLRLRPIRATEWIRGFFTGEGTWNLWYYQGCLHSMALDQPPEPEPLGHPDQAREAVSGPMSRKTKDWLRSNDEHAGSAINALNRAVSVRSMRGKTAIEAGVSDWLFFRDPDLDRLRPHLRFSRWSDGLFETDESDMKLELADQLLNFWSKGRYERPERLARLAGETFTVDLFSGPVRSTAVYFADQASKLGQADGPSFTDCWELLQREHKAWCQIVGLPRFIGSPQMRVRAWRTVKDVAGGYLDYVIYPNTLSRYRRFRLFPVKSVVEHINVACAQSAADLKLVGASRHRGRSPKPGHADALHYVEGSTPNLERLLRRASKRWWVLLDALYEGDVGTAPALSAEESDKTKSDTIESSMVGGPADVGLASRDVA